MAIPPARTLVVEAALAGRVKPARYEASKLAMVMMTCILLNDLTFTDFPPYQIVGYCVEQRF
jgi:hypothetical protein